MGLEGDSILAFFEQAKEPVRDAAREMSEDSADKLVDIVKTNTPIDTSVMDLTAMTEGGGQVRLDYTPGFLRESIEAIELKVVEGPEETVYATGADTNVPYALYVEEGTGLWGPHKAKYIIRPKRPDGFLSWISRKPFTRKDGKVVPAGTRVYAREIHHPGSPGAHMFAIGAAMLEHEFEMIAQPALERMKQRIERGS